MEIFFKDSDNIVRGHEYAVSDESYRYRAIMRENALTLQISMPVYVNIPVGAYCEFLGANYTLLRPQNFKKNNSRNFEYTLILESDKAKAGLYKFREIVAGGNSYGGTKKLKFSLTAKPKEHLQMFVDNMNYRELSADKWSVGECIESTEKVISYNHTGCDEAVKMIAEAFKTEYEFVGKQVNLKKIEYNKSLSGAIPLSYGFGNGFKSGLKRDNFDQSKAVEILYVQGGDKNIVPANGVSELLLPKSTTLKYDGTFFEGETGFVLANARIYISDADGLSIKRLGKEPKTYAEGSLDCAHIFPERVGTVTDVEMHHNEADGTNTDNDLCDFFDKDTAIGAWGGGLPLVAIEGIPENLNYSSCRVAGEKATVIFQSGMLIGKEFDILQSEASLNGYVHTERRFKLVQQQIDGFPMPTGVFKPAKGDKYAVFGISLPESYVQDASMRMFKEAVKYFYENEDDRFSFTGELDPIWAKRNWNDPTINLNSKIKLGGYVAFQDSDFQTPVLIRIVGIKDFINFPKSPQLELSNVTVGGNSLSSALGQITQNEVIVEDGKREVLQFAKRGFKAAKETSAMLEESYLSNFSTGISPMTVHTMQMLIGDESLQFGFMDGLYNAETKPNPTTLTCPLDIIDGRLKSKTDRTPAYIQHFTLGAKVMSTTKGSVAGFRHWQIGENSTDSFDSGVLIPSQGYYVYAKVPKAVDSLEYGHFEISATSLLLDQLENYYYLLVGVLTSEIDGERSFSTLYGFTEVLPGRITTEKIVSSNGKTFFDLENNKIGGTIDFQDGLISGEIVLKNEEDVIMAGINGLKDALYRFWSGNANPSLANFSVDKDGSLYAAGGKFKALADGTIEIEFRKILDDGDIIITINSSTGIISTRKEGFNNSISEMSVDGIIVNGGNVQALPASSGIEFKASVVGLGFGDVEKDTYSGSAALCGIYGDATNENANPAPSWGGYFKRLHAHGMYYNSRQIETTKTLNEYDVFISCYNTSDISLYLPPNPQLGQALFIKLMNAKLVNIDGNGNNIFSNESSTYYNVVDKGQGITLCWDGQFWLLGLI